ncbi:MAG: hypothetical protein LUE19_08025 [Clostridiales bacterium]|nr:hypothetical protein [Clostridiales bacterium]
MLGKLLKYELKSFSRLLGIIYIAVLAVAAVTGLLLRGSLWSESVASGSGTALVIFIIAYAVIIVALILITILMNIQRFYNSMLGGEGYLTHTLPVPTWMHISTKTISALIFTVLSGAVLVVSALLLLACSSLSEIFSYGLSKIISEFGGVFWGNRASFALCVIAMIFQLIRLILMFYISMAIGGSAKKNKILLSVVTFIVIVIITSVISNLTGRGFVNQLISVDYYSDSGTRIWLDSEDTSTNLTGLVGTGYYVREIIVDAIYSVIFFALSTFFLKRKLNLE